MFQERKKVCENQDEKNLPEVSREHGGCLRSSYCYVAFLASVRHVLLVLQGRAQQVNPGQPQKDPQPSCPEGHCSNLSLRLEKGVMT